jgi:(1->4)-alpha-D-glucan 1-alpha-D-glucosylmutase
MTPPNTTWETPAEELAPTTDARTKVQRCLEDMARGEGRKIPVSTYRVQMNREFRFVDAIRIIPYLAQLGVTTFYASPILKARAGSMHGYDIIDHNQINEEIGTEAEFFALVNALRERGMTLILDVVPNHMGVGYGTNPWWQDVLQNGRASKFANYFDIDWDPLKEELANKVLLPVLGNPYGEELEAGRLKLRFTGREFCLDYYDRVLPIDPQTYPMIVRPMGEPDTTTAEGRELLGLLAAFAELPHHETEDSERATKRQKQLPFLLQRLRELMARSAAMREYVERAVDRINGKIGDPRSFDALHQLLEHQVYRLAHWRVSAEEINYRRFFDINDLIGLRMEDPQVFASTQGLIRRLLGTGAVSGLRVDHPDGLFNPPQYFQRLQMLYAASQCYGPEPQGQLAENGIEEEMQAEFGRHDWRKEKAPMYVVVEKILERGEELPSEWPVAGTVGYEFANLLTNLFIDANAERTFTNLYTRFIGETMDVNRLIYQSKKLIMHSALSSEVNVLAHLLDEISSMDRRARDFTRKSLRDAIREAIACFPIYRTYIDERGNITERDRRFIEQAIRRAKRANTSIPGPVFDFLQDILLLRGNDDSSPVYGYRKQLYFTLKFQQLSGPVMAKGLEDTSCYIYNRFVAVNEVGGAPSEFGISAAEFHEANQKRQEQWPRQMLASSTHDTKRSEDVRARLAVLSEMPRGWASQSIRWRRINKPRRSMMGEGHSAPDANEEYLLYQTLVGTWPMPRKIEDGFALDDSARAQYTKRIQQYMIKAVNEAKVNMSWINPNPEYTEGLENFVAKILKPGTEAKPNSFLRLITEFAQKVAFFGAINSLSQTLVKLTAPGIPDVYQGQEMFDFSVVDPDNRRPVDFGIRNAVLNAMSCDESGWTEHCAEMLRNWTDGRTKMWVTYKALQTRKELRDLFDGGSYVALRSSGAKAGHALGFTRSLNGKSAVTVFPRFVHTLMGGEMRMPLGNAWGETKIALPEGEFVNVFTGERVRGGEVQCADVFRSFPVALLVSA